MGRRSCGTGSLFVRVDGRGVETWYAQWRVGGRLVKRRIGPKRRSSSADGLTKAQARHRRRFARHLTFTDPAHQQALDELRGAPAGRKTSRSSAARSPATTG